MRNHLKITLAAAVSGLAIIAAAPALAGVESMYDVRDANRNCSAPQERGSAIWRPGQGTLIIGGSGNADFEFYGHGSDAGGASLSGISGSSADRVDGRGGAANGAHGCGNIGSLVVRFDLKTQTSANAGTLHIGGESIPFKQVPRVAQDVVWDAANRADGHTLSGGTGGGGGSTVSGSPVTGTNNSGGCDPTFGSCQSSSVQAPSGSSGTGPDERTLARCGDAFGLKSEITNNSKDLTITLPVNRAAMDACFSRHLLTRYVVKGVNDNVTLSGGLPTLSLTANNGLAASLRAQTGLADKAGLITINAETLRTFVGNRTFDLDVTPGSTTSKLRLILKSNPEYGPKTITVPLVLATGRLNSNLTLRVGTYQASKAGESYAWSLVAADGSRERCFTETSGNITAPVGVTTFDLPLSVVETPACYGKSYRVTVTTASLAGQVSGSPFDETATFTLAALATVRNLPSGPTSPVTGARVQTQ